MGVLNSLLLRTARKWMAGTTAQEALARARISNGRGMDAIVNLLGERSTTQSQVDWAYREYLSLLEEIRKEGLKACISVKPTQLGAAINEGACRKVLDELAEQSHALGSFLWIDMENSPYTEMTVRVYLDLLDRFGEVGMALQAYLPRSDQDLEKILAKSGKVRLCKGAYREPKGTTLDSRRKIDLHYSELMERLFEGGEGFGIATHDSKLIERAKELSGAFHRNFEFQFLIGIRDGIKSGIVREGYRVKEYVPYGRDWLGYSMRRLRERKRNVLLLARSVFS